MRARFQRVRGGPSCLWLAGLALLSVQPGASAAARKEPGPKREPLPSHVIIKSHFAVRHTLPKDSGRKYASLAEKTYDKFCRVFDVPEGEAVWEGKCRIYLFADRAQFVKFAAQFHKSMSGVYSGGYTRITKKNPEIVLYLTEKDHTRLQQTLIHEMAHVFLQLFRKEAYIPTWLHEGCAQFFEFQHLPERSRLATSKALVLKLVQQNAHRPFPLFLRARFAGTDFVSYAQAWSMLDFMINAKKGSSKRTSRFVLLLKERRSQEEALQAAFGTTIENLEAAWKEYVLATYGAPTPGAAEGAAAKGEN